MFLSAGALDLSFGSGGVASMRFGGDHLGMFHTAAVQADGKVIVAGEAEILEGGELGNPRTAGGFVARFNVDGTVDRSFGDDGFALVTRPGDDDPLFYDVEVLANGKILAAGSPRGGGFLVARLNRDGTPDATFGTAGVTATPFYASGHQYARAGTVANALAVAPDGKIVLAGVTEGPGAFDNNQADVALARYTADGRLDPTFGGDGIVLTDFGAHQILSDFEEARDVAVAPDGSVVIAGDLEISSEGVDQAIVARYRPDGSLDRSFSGDGLVTLGWGPQRPTASAVKLRPDGRVVVVGNYRDTRGFVRNAVAQLKPDGAFDTSFGIGGTSQFGFGNRTQVYDVQIQSDGNVLVGAASDESELRDKVFAVARVDARGGLDMTFGTGGKVVHHLSSQFVRPQVSPADLVLAPDGRIVMVGDANGRRDYPLSIIAARFQGNTPTPPPPPPPPPGGAVTVQAESSTAMQGAVVSKGSPGYTGTGFVDYVADSGGSVTWRVGGLAGPGNYVVDFRYANGSSSARRLQIDANVPNNPSQIVSFTPTGSWSTWKTLSVPVTVTGGTSMTITASSVGSNGPNLDALTARPAAQAARTLQAEEATVVGARVARDVAGYTGTGFVDFLHNSGDSIEWTIDNPVAGVYALVLRYANGSTTDRSASLWVNGEEVNESLGFASTGSWSTWREVSWTVRLESGTNRIRLQANGRAAPNVDAMTVRAAV